MMRKSSACGVGLDSPAGSSPQASRPEAKLSTLRWLGRKISSLVVFGALGGLLLWGHHSGWTIPKFSALTGHGDQEGANWCGEHNVPESECVECNPDLLPKSKTFGWCKTHGVHECPLCHPEVAQTKSRPQTAALKLAWAKRPDSAAWPQNNSKCTLHERRIQFVSQESVEKAGIAVETVGMAPVTETITGSGEITYDQTRTARLSARLPGTIFQADKQVGDRVKQGDVMALVDAVEVGRAKSELLQALVEVRLKAKNFEGLSAAANSGAIPERKLREAEAALSEANIRLTATQQALTNLGLPIQAESLKAVPEDQLPDRVRLLGLPKSLATSLDSHTTGNLLPVRSPLDGVVVARDVVAGEVVDTTKVLFAVADVRQMWLNLDLRLEDARRAARGQPVRFWPDGGQEAHGHIIWISTEADHQTRTVKIRACLPNADGRLRANTFGTGKVILHVENQSVVVPSTAVQWEGCCYVVFVRDKDFSREGFPKVFHVRTVCLGAKDDQQTQIVAGILPGEVVATTGSSLLRAELLKGNLGEGCACCKK
jgi:cobalt-zinc-cadmium efflux system membrane fusion protein